MATPIPIAIDTGGTFTDAVLEGGDGTRRTLKVLSSGAMRATVTAGSRAGEIRVDAGALRAASAPDAERAVDCLRGWRLRSGELDREIESLHVEGDAWRLVLAGDGTASGARAWREICPPVGALVDLVSPWPAPILAARLLLRLAADCPLPPIAMRLGTTRGTNAMLEGRFDPVLLIANRGLGEALLIGDQRRDRLFDPAPRRQVPIHRAVVEIECRQDAMGRTIDVLDEQALLAMLSGARSQFGVTHAAVVLMHAWRQAEAERLVTGLARKAGFKRVVASHECSGIEGYLARGMATIADAALSSAVGDFLDAVRAHLSPGSTLEVATSAAALRPAQGFPPRESLLSGPAGGAVAALALARRARASRRAPSSSLEGSVGGGDAARSFDGVLGFDMGGTSTDAIRVADHLPRRELTPLAGRLLAVPSVTIESVAAGGGSICTFEHGILRVGPESAGSAPGPACYGRGGPLTVTDVDLLLGRADPAHFAVPLDRTHAEQALERVLAAQAMGGVARSPQQTLEVLAAIADDAMASALRVISAREGFAPADHVLVAFGGAGGQHACAIAERLGMTTIVHPAAAGVLSASGMTALRRERTRSEGVHRPLSIEALCLGVDRAMAGLCRESPPVPGAALAAERCDAAIGWRGQSAVLECAFELDPRGAPQVEPARLIELAQERYRAIFGAEPPRSAAELVFVRVTACWRASSATRSEVTAPSGDRSVTGMATSLTSSASEAATMAGASSHELPERRHPMCSRGQWVSTQLIHRASIPMDLQIDGPAVIADAHATLVIDRGWRGVLRDDGAIEVTSTDPARGGSAIEARRTERVVSSHGLQASSPSRAPASEEGPPSHAGVSTMPIEIRSAAVAACAIEMGEQLRRTAVSVNVRERLDYSCGVLDDLGRLASCAPHVPVHLGALGACVRSIMRVVPLRAGDVAVTNDPASGGSHLPDVTVVMAVGLPVSGTASIESQAPIALLAARAHHAEIGGTRPGSMPPSARSLVEEGVVIPPLLIGRHGVIDLDPVERALRNAPFPSRAIEDNLADLAAAVAALRRGATIIHELVRREGPDALQQAFADLQHRARKRVIERVRSLPSDFDRIIEQRLDDGWPLRVRVARNGDRLLVDFTGSGPVHPGNLNAPLAVVRSAVMYALRVWIEAHEAHDDRSLPLNDGLLDAVEVRVPEGLLDPPRDAPVAAGNTETSQRIVDALLLALSVAACSQGTMNNLVMGGDAWSFYETIAGGIGATSTTAGCSGLHAHMTNTRITDPETLERRMPLRLRRFSLRHGSGGAGLHAGGDGLIREMEFLAPAEISFISQRRRDGPDGLAGGGAGAPGLQRLVRADGRVETLDGIFEATAHPGDRLAIETPGGGAYGQPHP